MDDFMTQATTIRENGAAVNPGADMLMRGHALQQTRTSFCTAMSVQKPRELPMVERRFLEEARMAGEDFYYGWGAGKDRIEGPSKGLACAAARCWGNCAIEVLPVQDLPDSWVFTACFVDLETGFTMSRQFRQSKKWTVHGRMDAERKDDIRFQIGQSKAVRNVVLNSLPDWLVNKAMDEAKKGVKDKLEKYIAANGLPAAQDIVIRSLAKLGVKEEAILAKFSVANKSALDIDKLVILRGDWTAIENGQERADDLFPAEAKPSPHAAGASGTDLLNAKEVPADKPAQKNGTKKADKTSAHPPERISASCRTRLGHLVATKGMDEEWVRERLQECGAKSLDSLTEDHGRSIVAHLEKLPDAAAVSQVVSRDPGVEDDDDVKAFMGS